MQMTCWMKPYNHNSSDLIFAETACPSRIDFSRVRRSRVSVLNEIDPPHPGGVLNPRSHPANSFYLFYLYLFYLYLKH